MKKVLSFLTFALMSTAAFAQWTKPVPAFQPMADDGKTVQYLYNVEAGAFFVGANDWGTRASISTTEGHPVKMTMQYDGGEPMGTWAIYNARKGDVSDWQAWSPEGWNNIWVDGGRGYANYWVVKSVGNNTYQISNPALCYGVLAAFNKFNGVTDTRLYMFDDEEEHFYDVGRNPLWQGVCSTWAFVSPTEYEAYPQKKIIYDTAMDLKKAIDNAEAECAGINIADEKAVYNNNKSTLAQLQAAIASVKAAVLKFKAKDATAEKPSDFTSSVPSNDFENGMEGWLSTTGAQNVTLATNRCDNNVYPGTTMTGYFLENWNPANFTGKIYTQLTGVPGGIYKLQMDAFANGGSDTYVYMNDYKTNENGKKSNGGSVKLACGNDIPAKFTVLGGIEDGATLEIGLEQAEATANWIGIDNVKLTYYGSGADAYKLWYNDVRQNIISELNNIVGPETKYDKNQKAAFEVALAKGDAANTKEDLIAAIDDIQKSFDACIASIETYKGLEDLVNEYKNDNTEFENGSLMTLFRGLVNAEDEEAGQAAITALAQKVPAENMVEVAPIQILIQCTYNTEYINNYIAALKALRGYCAVNSPLGEGADATKLLANPSFKDGLNGWTSTKDDIAVGGLVPGFPVAESYHSAFDFYQNVSLPNGLYALSFNGFSRPDNGKTEVAAEIYMNDFATPFKSLLDEYTTVEAAVDGINCYLSTGNTSAALMSNPIFNGSKSQSAFDGADKWYQEEGCYRPNSMQGSSVAFSAGRYHTTVYGLVEDGQMKIGTRCSSDNQWVIWSNFELTYWGENADIAKEALRNAVSQASNWAKINKQNINEATNKKLLGAIVLAQSNYDIPSAELIQKFKNLNTALTEAKAVLEIVAEKNDVAESLSTAKKQFSETATPEALERAVELLGKAEDHYKLSTEQIKKLIEDMKEAIKDLMLVNPSKASDEEPMDLTYVIDNANLEQGADEGWSYTKKDGIDGPNLASGWDGKACEFKANSAEDLEFNYWQTVKLSEGTYRIAVEAANSLDGQASLGNDGKAYLYAGIIVDGDTTYVNDLPVFPQEKACTDSHYSHYVSFKVPAPAAHVVLGVMSVGTMDARWFVCDNFKLEYYGNQSSKEVSEGKEVNKYIAGQKVPEIELDVEDGAQVDPVETNFINIVVAIPDGQTKETELLVEGTIVDEQGNFVQSFTGFTTFEDGIIINISRMAVDKNYTINITHIAYGEVVGYDEETYMPIYENEFVAGEGESFAELHFAVMGPKMKYLATRQSIIAEMNEKVGPATKYNKNLKATFEATLAAGDQATTDEAFIKAMEDLKANAEAIYASIDVYQALEDKRVQILGESGEYEPTELLNTFYNLMTDDCDQANSALESLKATFIPKSLLTDIIAPIVILTECTYSDENVETVMEAIDKLYEVCINPAPAIVLEKIATIGKVEYNDYCYALIYLARAAYDKLTVDEKALITPEDYKVLTDAEETYAKLKAEGDKAAADNVIALINAIGTVEYTAECKELIDMARDAYEDLIKDQKALISAEQYKVLTDAEAEYKRLEGVVTGIDNADAANTMKDGKYIQNGKIIIVKNGKQYNAQGHIIK